MLTVKDTRRPLTFLAIWLLGMLDARLAPAAHDQLLPETTLVYFSTDNLEQLQNRWHSTQFWQLYSDQSMASFRSEWRRYLESKSEVFLEQTGLKTGELTDVIQGEASFARILLGEFRLATVLLADVRGKGAEVKAVLEKGGRRLEQAGASREIRNVRGVAVTVFHLPQKDLPSQHTVYLIHDGLLCIATDLEIVDGVLARLSGSEQGCLADATAYKEIQETCDNEPHASEPNARWFVDIVSYIKASNPHDPDDLEETNLGESLSKHGADALQGMGGVLTVGQEAQDTTIRMMVYAPQPYHGAMAMFCLPTSDDFAPQPWIPDDVNMYATLNWDLLKVIDNIGPLFDDLVGGGVEGTFDDLLSDLKASDGPGVDLRNDFVAHLGPRLILLNNSESPASEGGERTLIAAEVQDEAAAALAVKKMLRDDPGVKRLRVTGYTNDLWQIGEDSDLFANGDQTVRLTSSAAIVANSHLLLATHTDLLRSLLRRNTANKTLLADAKDLQRIDAALDAYLPGPGVGRIYSRTRRDFATTYELLRRDLVDQSQSIYGILASQLLKQMRDKETGKLPLDFSTLAHFEHIRDYLGLLGIAGKNHSNGWYVVIVALPPE